MAASSKSGQVSKDLNLLLDKLAGIPDGSDDKALKIMKKQGEGTGTKVAFGMWLGGCYYVRSSRGTKVGKTGRWRLVKCLA